MDDYEGDPDVDIDDIIDEDDEIEEIDEVNDDSGNSDNETNQDSENDEDEDEDDIDEEIEKVKIMTDIKDVSTVYKYWEENRENRISMPFLTKYERAAILGVRAKQISAGAHPLIDPGTETNLLKIAYLELKQGKLPFILKRKVGENIEYWKVKELINIDN